MKSIQYGDNKLYIENSDDYECLKITEQEKTSLEAFNKMGYFLINDLLEEGLDKSLKNSNKEFIWDFGYNDLKNELDNLCDVYSIMYKNVKSNNLNSNLNFKIVYRGTSNENIKNIKEGQSINRCISTTLDSKMAENKFSLKYKNPAYIEMMVQNDVPYVSVSDVLDEELYEIGTPQEVVLAPFLNIEKKLYTGHSEVKNSFGNVYQEKYIIKVVKQNLEKLSNVEEEKLEKEVIVEAGKKSNDFSYLVYLKQKTEKLKIKKEKLINKLSKIDVKDKVNNEINIIDDKIKENEKIIEKEISQIEEWKSKFKILCMSKFKTIEENIDKEFLEENKLEENKLKYKQEKFVFDKNEKEFKESVQNIKDKQEKIYKQIKDIIEMQKETDEIEYKLKLKCYKYLNNPEELEKINNNYYEKIQKWLISKLNGYSSSSLQNNIIEKNDIEDLRKKYENNVKLSQDVKIVSNKFTDVYNIIELKDFENFEKMQLNALKKGIFDKYYLIKAQIHNKQLDEEYRKIEQKSIIKKVADFIDGNNNINKKKKKKIKEVIKSVDNKIHYIKSNNEPNEDEEYDLEKLVAKMEVFCVEGLCDVDFSKKYLFEIHLIMTLNKGVKKLFDIDRNQVDKIKEEIKNLNLEKKANQEMNKKRKNKKVEQIKEFNQQKDKFKIENDYLETENVNYDFKYNLQVKNKIQSNLNQVYELMKDINAYIEEPKIENENEKDRDYE